MKTIDMNQKGRVQRTTTTINIGTELNQLAGKPHSLERPLTGGPRGAEDYLALCKEIVGGI
jgi:hypothetical protein